MWRQTPYRAKRAVSALGAENAGKTAKLYRMEETTGEWILSGIFNITDSGQAMFAWCGNADYIAVVEK